MNNFITYLKVGLQVVLVLLLAFGCNMEQDPAPNRINIPPGKGYERLSQYNFFVGTLNKLQPNAEAGVLPYDLNTPLFSDYALKKRFIYIPEGESIPFKEVGTLELPVGSVLIKHFYYENDNNYIETRLLIHQSDGWVPETYIWNEAGSEAYRSVVGETKRISINQDGQSQIFNYLIPNQNQCKNCHGYEGKINPIGPVIANINKEYPYEDGNANQIDKWIAAGVLESDNEPQRPKWPIMDDQSVSLNERSRAYLAVNCSSCHRPEGSAANSGLYLEYNNADSLSTGFWKTPVAAGDGSGGLKYVIRPGNAEESILYFRMNTSDVEARMPEIGRELIHKEGVELIKSWIDNMD